MPSAGRSTGCPDGRLRAALKYAQERLQFGKPIGSFQLIQDLLAKMLANITACQCLMVRAGATGRRRQADGRTCGARQGILHGQMPRDGRLGARGARRQRHRRRLQRRALLRRCRSALLLRRHLPDAEPDRRQGDHRVQRLCVNASVAFHSRLAAARRSHMPQQFSSSRMQ